MSSYLSDFEHTKLDAHVYPGVVVETHHISDPASGRRRIPQTKVWKVERVLGRGGSGEVRLEFNADGDERRAVKRIWGNGTTLKREYEMELRALLEFSKPKYKQAAVFVEFYGWFEDHESVYLAMEHISLGDLEHNVPARLGAVTEPEIIDINILVCKGSPAWWIKLTDFGVSKRHTEDTELRTQTGTRPYMAPEVLNYVSDIDSENSGYTKAVDMWALGCIIHRLTSGVIPFPPGPSLGNFCNNQNLFPFNTIGLSTQGIALMRGLLQPHPSTRLDVQQALAHPWILNINQEIVTQSQQIELDLSTTIQSSWNTVTHAGLRSISSVSGTQELLDITLKQQRSSNVTNVHSQTEHTDADLNSKFKRQSSERKTNHPIDELQQYPRSRSPKNPFGSKDNAPPETQDITRNRREIAQETLVARNVSPIPPHDGPQNSITELEQVVSTSVTTPEKLMDADAYCKALTTYSVFAIRGHRYDEFDAGNYNLGGEDILEQQYSQDEIVSKLASLDVMTPSFSEKMTYLPHFRRAAIAAFMNRLQSIGHEAENFEWDLIQVEYDSGAPHHRNLIGPIDLTAYVKRAPKKNVNLAILYHSIQQSKGQKSNEISLSRSTLNSDQQITNQQMILQVPNEVFPPGSTLESGQPNHLWTDPQIPSEDFLSGSTFESGQPDHQWTDWGGPPQRTVNYEQNHLVYGDSPPAAAQSSYYKRRPRRGWWQTWAPSFLQ